MPDTKPTARPQLHFTPKRNWMNDPNGLVYLDGEYHLFFQYNPSADIWGEIGWGHAVSRDLVNWEELPMAFPADDHGMAFSGSAVVDTKNRSGLGDGNAPVLLAFYTCHAPSSRQSQYLAYSNDKGRSWQRYANNPVVDIGSESFRDPKVMWHEPSEQWIMAVVLASECKVQFFGSPDARNWTYLSSFGPAGNIEGDWECPDLIPLPVDGNPDDIRWLLKVDNTLGGAGGGSGGQYFIGDFDGTTFTVDHAANRGEPDSLPMRPVDYGSDFYAAMSWSQLPPEAGRQLWLGWMSNWVYASMVPTRPFRGIQSLPRSLHLRRGGGAIRLAQRPAAEIEALRGRHAAWDDVALQAGESLTLDDAAPPAFDLAMTFTLDENSRLALCLRDDKDGDTRVIFDASNGEWSVDRSRTSKQVFHSDFPASFIAPMPVHNGEIDLRLVVDGCCLEAFAGCGESVISCLFFPEGRLTSLGISCDEGAARIRRADLWRLET